METGTDLTVTQKWRFKRTRRKKASKLTRWGLESEKSLRFEIWREWREQLKNFIVQVVRVEGDRWKFWPRPKGWLTNSQHIFYDLWWFFYEYWVENFEPDHRVTIVKSAAAGHRPNIANCAQTGLMKWRKLCFWKTRYNLCHITVEKFLGLGFFSVIKIRLFNYKWVVERIRNELLGKMRV